MHNELSEEIRKADKDTQAKFRSLLDRLRHLSPTLEVQRKLLSGLLKRQQDSFQTTPG